jgi:hypothetical protein
MNTATVCALLVFLGPALTRSEIVNVTFDHLPSSGDISQSPPNSTASFSSTGVQFSPTRASYHADAQANAFTPASFGAGASAEAPSANRNPTFTLSLAGSAGVLIVSGNAAVTTSVRGASVSPSFTRAIAMAGGSAAWNFGQGAGNKSWSAGSDITSSAYTAKGESPSNAASAVILVPAGNRSMTITDNTRATVTAYSTGQSAMASATVSGGWTAGFVPGNTLQEARDNVLRGAVSAAPNPADPAQMIGAFTPNYGLTLKETADLFGIDHFNWVSYIIEWPTQWTVNLVNNNGEVVRQENPPLLDPIVNNTTDPNAPYYYAIDSQNAHTRGLVFVAPPADDKPGYYNVQDGEIRNPSYTEPYRLNFIDRPGVPQGFLAPGEKWRFATQLVGEDANGNTVFVPGGLGTAFSWDTDTVVAGDVVYTKNTGVLGTVISGGVFNVQIVPEPSAVLLGLFGALATVLARRRAGRKQRTERSA